MGYVDEELVTLYGTGYPSARLLKTEKKKFLRKVSDYINDDEVMNEIKRIHNYELSKAYFREGHIKDGIYYLKDGHIISARDLLSLLWSIVSGVKTRI